MTPQEELHHLKQNRIFRLLALGHAQANIERDEARIEELEQEIRERTT